MRVAPEARLDDGKLDIIVFEDFRRVKLVTHLIAAIGGRRPNNASRRIAGAHAGRLTPPALDPDRLDRCRDDPDRRLDQPR
jgi:diacylglycerol kinase family enzyme